MAAVAPALRASSARRTLGGFALSGFLAALLGAILPVWGYHLKFEFATAGHYFLGMAAGTAVAHEAGRRLRGRSSRFRLSLACAVACLGLALLSLVSPPAAAGWRIGGMALVGLALGLLNGSLFQAIHPSWRQDPAATINVAGIFFGAGCLVSALLAGALFYSAPASGILALMAVIPAAFALLYARTPAAPGGTTPRGDLRMKLLGFRNPAAILLALLVFFQFGNEWSVAGWLPVFLIHRTGMSPETSLRYLAMYWMALTLGRVAAMAVLPRMPHGRLLLGSAGAALFGCILLMGTDNAEGAAVGVLLVGLGYAAVYPLVAEMIGHRFAYYRPGQFNGIFSVALMGGLLAPAILGYAADAWGVGTVMLLPLVGTCMVVLLVLLIWLEAKIGG